MGASLRDKALLLFLFQTGCRVNVVEHLRYGQVADQLGHSIVTLKITGDLDHKLRSRDIPFYYTFLSGEGVETLSQYCQKYHAARDVNKPLFCTRTGKAISQTYVWIIVKRCVERAGFNPQLTTTHTLRKAFRRQVAQASNVDAEFKEQIMGHVIQGSREHYFDRHNLAWFRREYGKLEFGREATGSQLVKLRTEMEQRFMARQESLQRQVAELQQHSVTLTKIAEVLNDPKKLKIFERLLSE